MAATPLIEHRPGTSRAARRVALFLRLFVRPVFTLQPLTPRWIRLSRAGLESLGRLRPALRGTRVERVSFDGFRAEWVRAPEAAGDRVVLYFHGGGFVSFGLNTHRRLVSYVSRAAGASVLSVDYRQLPTCGLSGSIADCVTAYRWLLEQGHSPARIVIAGDSAGGTLAYAVSLAILNEGLPAHAGIVALSPWLDFDCTAKAAHPNAPRDAYIPVSTLIKLAPKVCESVPFEQLSPLHADLRRLPPSLLQAGGGEVLCHDAELMAERLAETGVPHRVQIWEGHVHVFQFFGDLVPEARAAVREIGAFVRDVTDVSGPVTEAVG